MVRIKRILSVTFSCLVLGAFSGGLAFGEWVPDPDMWLKALRESPPSQRGQGAAPSRIAIVRWASSGQVSFVAVRGPLSFLEVADPEDARWTLKINAAALPQGGKQLEPQALMDASDADLLLDLGEGRPPQWRLVRSGDGGSAEALVEGASGADLTPRGVAAFLRRTLGYDAVVLAQKGPFVLALTPDLSQVAERYAVAVEGSAERYTIDEKIQTGSGFLALGRGGARVSVFRVLSSKSPTPFPFATKLILQKDPPPKAQ
jgi:hypothetical protein